jgi:hypothetical protein
MMVVLCCSVVGGTGEYGKSDGFTISTTYAGAIWTYFFIRYKIVHLEKVGMSFTDSYVEGVHFGEMSNFVHISPRCKWTSKRTRYL